MNARQVAISSLMRIAAALLALAAQVIYVRVFGVEQFGFYVEIVTVASMALALFGLGADKVVVREIAPLAGTPAVVGVLVRLMTFQAGAVGVGLLCITGYMVLAGRSGLGWAVGLAIALMATQFLSAFCRAHDRHRSVDAIELLVKPLLALGIALCVHAWHGHQPTWGVVFGMLLAQLLAVLMLAMLANQLCSVPESTPTEPVAPPLPPWQGRLRYLILGAVSYSVFQLDTLVVSLTLPPGQLAAYGMASSLAKVVSFVPAIMATQSMPTLARVMAQHGEPSGAAAKLYRHTERRALIAGVVGWVTVLLFGQSVLRAINVEFEIAFPALCVLCLGHIANSLTQCLVAFLAIARREHVLIRGQVIGALIAVAGYAVLAPGFGLLGTAVAAALAMVAMFGCLRWDSGAFND